MTEEKVRLSPEQVDALSKARATKNQRNTAFFLLGIMILLSVAAFILQGQQTQTQKLVEEQRIESVRQANIAREQCIQRRENVLRANNTWSGLAEIEKQNTNKVVREARIKMYENAMLEVPDCTQQGG